MSQLLSQLGFDNLVYFNALIDGLQVSENVRVLLFVKKVVLTGLAFALLSTGASLGCRKLRFPNYKFFARVLYFGVSFTS